ncbi:MAG: hypothetical protein NTV48_02120 [Candidatus Vogelbacteria bacterium]|nr:hypothetical protein [Candidatus Vogelbacteria bacterium]
MKIKRFLLIAVPLVFLPLVSFGAGATLKDLIEGIGKSIFAPLIPVLIGIALIFFFYGLIQYLQAGMGEKQVEEAKKLMFWGIITLFVMISVWGLAGILKDTFFKGDTPNAPTTLPKF